MHNNHTGFYAAKIYTYYSNILSIAPPLTLLFQSQTFLFRHLYRSLPFLLRYLLNGFPGLSTDISEHICLLLLVLFCFPFLVLGFRALDKGDSCRLLSSR